MRRSPDAGGGGEDRIKMLVNRLRERKEQKKGEVDFGTPKRKQKGCKVAGWKVRTIRASIKRILL